MIEFVYFIYLKKANNSQRKTTEEGYRIYSSAELKIGKGFLYKQPNNNKLNT